jgi:hypothetical protein
LLKFINSIYLREESMMKKYFKSLRALTFSSALVFCAVSVNAQTFFATSFSAAEGYTNGELVGQPAGGSPVWVDRNEADPALSYAVVNEQLVITQKGSGAEWVSIELPVQNDGILTVTWDWQYVGPDTGEVDHGFCISDTANFLAVDGNAAANFNEQGAMIRMQQDTPAIDARNGDFAGGGSYAADASVEYQSGTKYAMRYEIDVFGLTFDAFATPEGGSEIQFANDYGFRRIPTVETDGINAIVLWDNGAEAGNQIIIDNIVVSGPEGPTNVSEWALY